ncbi:peptidoglycan-associated lipoprotein [Dissulfurispira thermophila]|uniref:Peptidoglycan-associated lipoprotein n=2 Tax=root TaxID=1 RepID=A0A7G1H599_9BACT|nr:peptidoglycan-associated lipoprotein Pal [Dissulfurispira thermophila]BCB97283.1 peptidoglycan-associated lipoprotein [Dissulfurispira thermophila]
MKRTYISILIILAIIMISGCAQRKIAGAPEQPTEQPNITKTEDRKTTTDTAITKEPMRESITEKQIAKTQPSEAQPSVKELQTQIQDIHFDFDRYDIREDAKPILKEVSTILLKNKNIKVIIEGHCDERGTNEYNLGLGDRRANSTKEYLISLGIPSSKIETISYGEEKPICTKQTEECWAKNRRAHFVFIEEGR